MKTVPMLHRARGTGDVAGTCGTEEMRPLGRKARATPGPTRSNPLLFAILGPSELTPYGGMRK
jgi:hypothetical protein